MTTTYQEAAAEAECEYIFENDAIPSFSYPKNVHLGEFIMQDVQRFAHKIAIIDTPNGQERKFTYREVQSLATNVAAGVAQLGVKKGRVVCMLLPNCAEYIILGLGILNAGAVFTGCNPACHPSEIEKQVMDSEAMVIITTPALLSKVINLDVQIVIVGGEAPSGTIAVQTLFDADGSKAPTVQISQDDVCILPYSSGTTGLSKGVMQTHKAIISNLCQTLALKNGELNFETLDHVQNCTLALLPFFHIFGMCGLFCSTMRTKGTLVIMERYDLRRLLHLLQRYDITFAPLVPPIVLQLVKSPVVEEFDLSKLKLKSILCAAAPLGSDLQQVFEARFPGVVICQAYGLTEYSCITISHGIPGSGRGPSKKGSVGFIVPGSKIKFVDIETGKSVPRNKLGELCARGPSVMKGYYKNLKATKATIDEQEWLHTGDVGYIDDDGDVFIVERIKDLIKYKGFQVPPAELEAVLLTHAAVADAAVVPVPDEEAGEFPAAHVVLSAEATITEEGLMAYVASQVASYKQIRLLKFVPSIPKSATGKILRKQVKKQILEDLHYQAIA